MRTAHIFSICLLLASLALTQGCATSGSAPAESEEAIAQPIERPGYYEVLHKEYAVLAEKAFREFDFMDAYKFNRKADQARLGLPVLPDEPTTRAASVAAHQEIRTAYATLNGYLEPRKLGIAPDQVARAQAAYDCWLEAAEESRHELFSGNCRRAYLDAVTMIENAIIDDALDTIEAPVLTTP